MASWATRRKSLYFLGAVLVVFLLAAIPVYQFFTKAPTCFDGVQNGDETGVDCGGSCTLLCTEEVIEPIVKWARPFAVLPGRYDAIAFIENPNVGAGLAEARYTMKLYDNNNILIAERVGATFVGPRDSFVVFEPNIETGERTPKSAFFEFTNLSAWERISSDAVPRIRIYNQVLNTDDASPRLTATVSQETLDVLRDIEIVAVLYDIDENAIGASRTLVPRLDPGEDRQIAFTWRDPFPGDPVRIEIIPRINIFE